ncbi:putative molybdopterin biosynthesis protein [Paenibacillus phyllosphaerae]|uniref:Putative molybdopterin biosynthesis protein n=1 Tax=Paenibacillus phyllosphaerae TaxID=274593 RepID=A0A7W5FLD7_9BACL|nr:helix-turn-helix transcriptional regulator [Paenibacillus phyllosphaerae]MBB3108882.1 putative molybdopterin biosynthesis protein [Paenibacillus phyllosphaerae]
MSSDMSYTTEEIAKLLKISKLTVYDLIKKGELPSYRVGKQMRVDASDLERYKQRAKGLTQIEIPSPAAAQPVMPPSARAHSGSLVITGQDISLDILSRHLEKQLTGIRPLRSHAGSMDSLVSMYRGESDIVSTHLLDGDSGEYNLPYIRRLFIGSSYLVVHLLARQAGLYVQPGNPRKLHTWSDLAQPGLRLVNRERGSGARVLLDEQLRLHGIASEQLTGYDFEQTNHLGVASKVASGEADVGVGIEKAAAIVGQVEFIPLIQERYDLVIMKNASTRAWLPTLLAILRSEAFRSELRAISGYDLTRTGDILFES